MLRDDASLRTGTFYPTAMVYYDLNKCNIKMVTDHFWNQQDEEVRLKMVEMEAQ